MGRRRKDWAREEPWAQISAAVWKNLLLSLAVTGSFFLLTEGAMRVAGVPSLLDERDPFEGFSRRVRVFEPDPASGVWRTARRATLQSFNRQAFALEKPPGTFRIFVLGGSSAFGFPWGAHIAFPRVLGDALAASYPGRRIEAVNAAAMSYASHRLRILTHEILDHDPDLLILYGGHNEFVERRFYGEILDRDARLDPLRALLHRSALYGWMTRRLVPAAQRAEAAREPDADPEETPGAMLGFDVDREESVVADDTERQVVREAFEANLRAILDLARARGVEVILCTVASNLRDWPPNRSAFDSATDVGSREEATRLLQRGTLALASGAAAEAITLLERARALAPGHALIEYRLGRAYEAMERYDDARDAYVRARDADAQPTRAPGDLNEAIRRLAAEKDVPLVDVERLFERKAPRGLVGLDLIEDYVHPTPHGHRLIALSIWETLVERGSAGEPPGEADPDRFWAAVGPAPDREAASRSAEATSDEERNRRAHFLYNMAGVLAHQGMVDRAIEAYRDCLELQPRLFVASYNLGRLHLYRGELDLAVERFEAALSVEPRHFKSLLGLGRVQVRRGRPGLAVATFRRAREIGPGSADVWNDLGHALTLTGSQEEAVDSFRKAASLDTRHYTARTNLGAALIRSGRLPEGIDALRESLAIRPDQRRARHELGAALARTGAFDEAEGIYRGLLEIAPDDERARAALTALEARRGEDP